MGYDNRKRSVLQTILPDNPVIKADNDNVAFRVLQLVTIISIIRSLIHIFKFDGGAGSIATIPLDEYSPAAAATVIVIFAQWGLSQVIVVLKYRGFVPFTYLLLFIEYVGRYTVGCMKPAVTRNTPVGVYSNYVLAPLSALMLATLLYNNCYAKTGKTNIS